MDDVIGPLVTAAIILYQVFNFLKRARGAGGQEEPASSPLSGPAPVEPDRTDADSALPPTPRIDPRRHARLVALLGRARQGVAEATSLEERLPQLLRTMASLGPSERVLVEVGQERLLPTLQATLPAARAFQERLEAATAAPGSGWMPDPEDLAPLQELERVAQQVQVLLQLSEWKADPVLSGHLADADAIAASMLAPLQQMAGVQGFRFPQQRPICAPAVPASESILLGLLPEGYPLVFVPDDFSEDLYRQASVAHEIGHLITLRIPGFRDELRDVTGLHSHGPLLEFDGRRLHGSLAWPYAAWLEEIIADAFTALLLGPAALRGLIHCFQRPDDPDAVLIARAKRGRYAEHPPAHLRVHLVADLLERMGFVVEPQALVAEWDALHGNADVVAFVTREGGLVSLPLVEVEEYGRALLVRFYETPFASLDGKTVEDLPFLEMTPGLWARVQRRAQELLSGQAFNEEGRIALAAAIEARAGHPEAAQTIAAGLRRAVLGRDAGERHVRDPRYQRRRLQVAGRFAHEVRDALLVGEILAPRGRLSRR